VDKKNRGQYLLNNFEEKYVGLYRWLLLVVGAFSFIGLLVLLFSLTWSTSESKLEDSSNYFSKPSWTSVRREVLPLRMKPNVEQTPQTPLEIERPLSLEVKKIHQNLMAQFSAEELGEAKKYFSIRLLNEWLLDEVLLEAEWRQRMLQDLVDTSLQIGSDDRIARIASVDGRSKIIMESLQSFVAAYLESVKVAESSARVVQTEADSVKERITTQILIAIPIAAGVFLSIIGLILLIRMELHLRKISIAYSSSNAK
jgi:hypothetical protein